MSKRRGERINKVAHVSTGERTSPTNMHVGTSCNLRMTFRSGKMTVPEGKISRVYRRDTSIPLISETPSRNRANAEYQLLKHPAARQGSNEVSKQITYIGKLLCAHPKLCNVVREITIAHLAALARHARCRSSKTFRKMDCASSTATFRIPKILRNVMVIQAKRNAAL